MLIILLCGMIVLVKHKYKVNFFKGRHVQDQNPKRFIILSIVSRMLKSFISQSGAKNLHINWRQNVLIVIGQLKLMTSLTASAVVVGSVY
jgi:hypothetical protein